MARDSGTDGVGSDSFDEMALMQRSAAQGAYQVYSHFSEHLVSADETNRTALSGGSDTGTLVALARGILWFPVNSHETRLAAGHLLLSLQRADGAFARDQDSISDRIRHTAHAVAALHHAEEHVSWIFAVQKGRRFLARVVENATGDFDTLPLLDLSFCMLGLSSGHDGRENHVEQLVAAVARHVLSRQQPSGHWMREDDGSKDPFLTASIAQALRSVAATMPRVLADDAALEAACEAAVKAAVAALLQAQNPDGSWSHRRRLDAVGSPDVSGAVALELLATGCDRQPIHNAVAWLLGSQEKYGGWQLDPTRNHRSDIVESTSGFLALAAFAGETISISPAEWIRTRGNLPVQEHDLYASGYRDYWHGLPETRPLDHTMSWALDDYVRQKLPMDVLADVLGNGGSVEVHQIFPSHFQEQASRIGLEKCVEITTGKKPGSKRWNYHRPGFFMAQRDGRPTLSVAVIPGRDYFFHYASLARHATHLLTAEADDRLTLYRYPLAEAGFLEWTGLDDALVQSDDRVILGYVDELSELLTEAPEATLIGETRNDFYGSRRFRLPDGSILNLLGVTLSYWGSLGANVARHICQLGAKEIIYTAKLGCLTSFADIYKRIFVPSQFVILHHDQLVEVVRPVPNGILARWPHLATGVHVSVPTVLEEDYRQREEATRHAANSIDNEIAQMANDVSIFNAIQEADVKFTALHFATDYIRQKHEKTLTTEFDLSNDKTDFARAQKRAMIGKIATEVLFPYLGIER